MALNNNDLFLVNQGGESKKITYQNLKTNLNADEALWELDGTNIQPKNDSHNVEIGGGDIQLNADGSAEFAGGDIELKADGSADFSGSILCGGPSPNPRSGLSSAGSLYAVKADGNTAVIFQGGTQSNQDNIRLLASGRGLFNGRIETGDSDDNILINAETATKPQIRFNASSGATGGSIGLNYTTAGAGSFAITTPGALQLGGNESTYFSGTVSVTTASGPDFARLNTEGFGSRLYRSTSLRKYKDDIKPFNEALDVAMKLRPVTFLSNCKEDKEGGEIFHGEDRQVGFVAEEVEECFTGLCTYNSIAKELTGVNYERLSAVAIGALQQAMARIENLESRINSLEGGY